MIERKLLCERPIHKPDFESVLIIDLLQSRDLLGSVTIVCPFVKSIVYEFLANMVRVSVIQNQPCFIRRILEALSWNFLLI